MPDMGEPLATLSDDELRASIAEAQAILRTRARKIPISAAPAIGMWKDREDMQDSASWEREVRKREWRDIPSIRILWWTPSVAFPLPYLVTAE